MLVRGDSGTVSVTKIDRFFEFQEALEGTPVTFEYGFRPAPGVDVREAVRGCPGLLGVREQGGFTWLHFHHGELDGLGAFAALRGHLSGRPAPRVTELTVPPDTTKPPARRALTRLRAPSAKLATGGAPRQEIAYFGLTERPDAPKASLLQRAVAETHRLALEESPAGSCSSILVSTTCVGWTPDRPASNASAGFFSVVAAGEADEAYERVRSEFRAARGSQRALMRRIEVFGSIPRFAWPALARLARRSDATAGGTASLAAIVGLEDEHLGALGSDWCIAAPFRRSSTVTVTIAGINGRLTGSVGAWEPRERCAELGEQILAPAGFDLERLL